MKSYYPPSDRLAIVDSGCRQLRLPRSNFSVAVVVEHRRRRCRCDPDFRAQLVSRVPTQRGRVPHPARQAVADIAAATDELQISAGLSIDAIVAAIRSARWATQPQISWMTTTSGWRLAKRAARLLFWPARLTLAALC
jgi:hypothetical protein